MDTEDIIIAVYEATYAAEFSQGGDAADDSEARHYAIESAIAAQHSLRDDYEIEDEYGSRLLDGMRVHEYGDPSVGGYVIEIDGPDVDSHGHVKVRYDCGVVIKHSVFPQGQYGPVVCDDIVGEVVLTKQT